ncbi:MAG TPA: carboxylating nicotinate-nucleotide diphosphorylase [Deltaproteobacteria bacterium]|mgnify:CR=1 FL=1|nr:carboxylating nicotinate-nucleotide diphosphorylase [Deltaproteobacteria bacterium]
MNNKNNYAQIKRLIEAALKEDIGAGDITTKGIVHSRTRGYAEALAKEEFIVAGIGVFRQVFLIHDRRIRLKGLARDGKRVKKGEILARLEGPLVSILAAERVALNLFQRMCGIATLTNRFVRAVAKTGAKIMDTRKTVPGLRLLDKMAVKIGGGVNHRMGLYDAVLIKDNHIAAAGSITEAVKRQKTALRKKIKIEVETKNLREVREALDCGVDIIMLDNMSLAQMKKAVNLIEGKALLEASGNMNLKRVAAVAETGVDFISVGQITHSVRAADVSLKIKEKQR